jgi:hypothetical protein
MLEPELGGEAMDDSVRAAMAKWPDVPGLHGWLSLDEAGHWRLKGDPITHPGLVAFIGRNYDCDDQGRWFFQNGPQRGYIDLAYTPWILHVDGGGTLRDHTGAAIERVEGAWVDDAGDLLLDTGRGPGLVDSDSLPMIVEWLVDASGASVELEGLEQAQAEMKAGRAADLHLRGPGGHTTAVGFVARADVPARFGFDPSPRAD